LASSAAPAARAQAQEGSVTIRELDPKTGESIQKVALPTVTYLSVGPIVSLVGGQASGLAAGGEVSFIHYPEARIPSFAYGAFAQAQEYWGREFRAALGGQASMGPAGVELGLGLRSGDGPFPTTFALHAGVFVSVGVMFIAFRAAPTLYAPNSAQTYGFETGFTIGLKLPIAIQGRDPSGWAIQAAGHAW
jgi:hypothetical protein